MTISTQDPASSGSNCADSAGSIRPIILFALPRSGSTLLQRMLGAHEQIETLAEPWILLPFLYALRREGVMSEYAHRLTYEAIQEFCEHIRGGEDGFKEELRHFALSLYSRAVTSSKTLYFLDKTPRYSLLTEDIVSLFPNGKFVFMFRNPLAVVASNNVTFAKGKWYVPNQKELLFTGLARMIEVLERNHRTVIRINFESLVQEPAKELKRLCSFLGIEFDVRMIEGFSGVDLKGSRGDPTGRKEYKSLSEAPLTKWRDSLSNPIRKAWSRRYLRWIGRDRLRTMGYDFDELIAEVCDISVTTRWLLSDAFRISRGVAYCALQGPTLKLGIANTFRGPWEAVHAYC